MTRKKDEKGAGDAPTKKRQLGNPGPSLMGKPADWSTQDSESPSNPRKTRKRLVGGLDQLPKNPDPDLQHVHNLLEELRMLREAKVHHEKLKQEVATLREQLQDLQTWRDSGDDIVVCPLCDSAFGGDR